MTAPVKPGAIEAIRDVKRYSARNDNTFTFEHLAGGGTVFVLASDFDQQTLALDSARQERDDAVDLAGARARRIDELLLAEVQYWRALKEAGEALREAINLRIALYRNHEDAGEFKPTAQIIQEDKWLSRWNAALSPTKAGTGGT